MSASARLTASAAALGLVLGAIASCQLVKAPEGIYSCSQEADCRADERCIHGACRYTHSAGCDAGNPDPPDDEFYDSNCDGIDGDERQAVFVDGLSGDDRAPGTPTRPMRTLAAAIAEAGRLGRTQVYVSTATYGESVTLGSSVSLHGGYVAAEGWRRHAEAWPLIEGGSIAVSISGPGPRTLERLEIRAAAGEAPGRPSIGARVVDSPGVIQLRWLRISAGDGAAGAPGDAGPPRSSLDASVEGEPGSYQELSDGGVGTPSRGGEGAVDYYCHTSVGGAGGASASAGASSLRRADGGLGASLLVCECDGGGCFASPLVTAPSPGADGLDGWPGDDGAGGSGRGDAGVLWLPADGKGGLSGVHGIGGGGGGGGLSSVATCGERRLFAYGGGGGGGGTGGCSGAPGQGGGGGGASIGLYVYNSNVLAEHLELRTGNGGRGGAGAAGRPGGLGMPGGDGGMAPPGSPLPSGAGAPGGRGGRGGRGGHGGGGAGGPTVGVWCIESTVELGEVIIAHDGQPGAGGESPGKPGGPGERCERIGCPAADCP